MSDTPRVVRAIDVDISAAGRVSQAIENLYDDTLDVVVVRRAFDAASLRAAGERLDRRDVDPGWARPNRRMPAEDIELLGTDAPATPTYEEPRGYSLDTYLDSAARHREGVQSAFAIDFDPAVEVPRVLGLFAGGRPVETARASDGRSYAPMTLRRLTDGKQIGPHHDYHFPLPLYRELAPQLDTQTLVSYVVTLRRPDAGGDLCVYAVTPQTPDAPKMPNGYSWDMQAVEARFHSVRITPDVGDLFLLASGRCLHRVDKIVGDTARVTLGGFLAFEAGRGRVVYWS